MPGQSRKNKSFDATGGGGAQAKQRPRSATETVLTDATLKAK